MNLSSPAIDRIDKYQFSIIRIILGIYFSFFFFFLIPKTASLFSSQGMLADPTLHETYAYFPSILYWQNSPEFCKIFCILSCISSICLAFGLFRRVAAFLTWYGLACFWNQNEIFWSPAMPLVGWLLLCYAFIEKGEPLSVTKKNPSWKLNPAYKTLALFTLGVAYSFSGIFKFLSPSWIDGNAIEDSLKWIWSRDWIYVDLYLGMPKLILNCVTWISLFGELLFLPLCFFKLGRPIAWLVVTMMQINILLLLDIIDLTTGVLIFHAFVFDVRWLGFLEQWRKRLLSVE